MLLTSSSAKCKPCSLVKHLGVAHLDLLQTGSDHMRLWTHYLCMMSISVIHMSFCLNSHIRYAIHHFTSFKFGLNPPETSHIAFGYEDAGTRRSPVSKFSVSTSSITITLCLAFVHRSPRSASIVDIAVPALPSVSSPTMSKSGVELLALSTPPSPARLPCLPSPPRAPAFTNDVKENYVLTTHIIQAAFPRTTPPVRAPAVPSPDLPFKDRQAGVKEAAAKALALRVDYQCGRLTQERDSRPLWMCANRYARKKVTGKGLTLVLMHANGFTKEVRL
jgi:hypothetical protein